MTIVYPATILGGKSEVLAKMRYCFSLFFCLTVCFKVICVSHKDKIKIFSYLVVVLLVTTFDQHLTPWPLNLM